jgi:hypothetical protein
VAPSGFAESSTNVYDSPNRVVSNSQTDAKASPPGSDLVRDADVTAGLIRAIRILLRSVCGMMPGPILAQQSDLGAQRRARIEGSSPAVRTLPSVQEPDLTSPGLADPRQTACFGRAAPNADRSDSPTTVTLSSVKSQAG